MQWAAVPEAAIDEDCDLRRDKNDIDHDAFYPTMQPIAKTEFMQGRAQSKFSSSILLLNPLHDFRSRQWHFGL